MSTISAGINVMQRARKLEPYFVLLIRVSLGVVFATAGYGKLTHLERTVQFFRELHIPAPEAQAVFIGSLELAGGICVAVGLLTRVVSLPLAGTMVVAIATALLPEVSGALDLLSLDETLYLFLLLWLTVAGAGKASLDHLLSRLVPALRAFAEPAATKRLPA
jgi:putative oxidoreductase